jgi:hypothetical protein
VFEIGASLREARSRRGIELAQAEHATKIRGKYLRALEAEQFELLPSDTYVKGFLRAYADYLGLDGQLYVDEYNSRFATGDDWESPRIARRARHERRQRRRQRNVVLLALAVVAAATTAVIGAWTTSGGGHLAPAAARAPAARHATAPRLLVVRAVRGSSRVIVHRDGANGPIVFEGTLGRGDAQAFSGTRFWLNVAAPENLAIEAAGKRLRLAGHRPWVLTVTLAPLRWEGHPA